MQRTEQKAGGMTNRFNRWEWIDILTRPTIQGCHHLLRKLEINPSQRPRQFFPAPRVVVWRDGVVHSVIACTLSSMLGGGARRAEEESVGVVRGRFVFPASRVVTVSSCRKVRLL